MLTWMLKPLAARHRSAGTKLDRKHMATIATPHGPRRCFEARTQRAGRKPLVDRFGGIPLNRQRKAVIDARPAAPLTRPRGSQLINRLRAGWCELGEHPARVQVHQVRKLADLAAAGQPQPAWAELMARKRRKTLAVSQNCHHTIHARQPAATQNPL